LVNQIPIFGSKGLKEETLNLLFDNFKKILEMKTFEA
jgi:hypothetical protein